MTATADITRRWLVAVTKPSGTRVVFSTHHVEADADNCARRLREFGLDAAVERIREADTAPGTTLRLPSRIRTATR